jgi:cytochrome c oxidase subunit 3
MKPYNQRAGVSIKKPVIERIEGIHPLKMINYLVISISCLLYAFISYMFIKHLAFELKGNFTFNLPKFYTISTILLICSVYFTSRMLNAYKNDEISLLRKLLSFTLISGLLFFISQTIAWMELLRNDFIPDSNNIITYVFVFSAIHLAFVLTGMIISAILFYKYMLIENDPVKTLIAATNPLEKVKLEIYTIFWHFNVISWVMIFLMFLFIF